MSRCFVRDVHEDNLLKAPEGERCNSDAALLFLLVVLGWLLLHADLLSISCTRFLSGAAEIPPSPALVSPYDYHVY